MIGVYNDEEVEFDYSEFIDRINDFLRKKTDEQLLKIIKKGEIEIPEEDVDLIELITSADREVLEYLFEDIIEDLAEEQYYFNKEDKWDV